MTIPTTTMYRVRRYLTVIEPVQVVRTTKIMAYILGRDGSQSREHLQGMSTTILPTWDEAHEWLLKVAEEELAHASRELDRHRTRCGQIAKMRKPVA